jgi:hypothetical protein
MVLLALQLQMVCSAQVFCCWCVCCRTSYRLWEQSEVADDVSSPLPPNPVADTFAQIMTGLYAKLQSSAGRLLVVAEGIGHLQVVPALEVCCSDG